MQKADPPPADINVVTDVAYCRNCNIAYSLAELTNGSELEAGVNLENPPPGAWYRRDTLETVIGATNRSAGPAFGILCFALFWNGITSIFVTIAISQTLQILNIPVPPWFPAPHMNNGPTGVGMILFQWLFLTPFMLIGLGMVAMLLSYVAGRTEIKIGSTEGIAFTGVGPLGLRKRFDLREVQQIRVDDRQWMDNDGHRQRKVAIVIETKAGKLIKFGSLLREDRRKFVAGALRKTIPA